jgi:hypothetical protein
MEKEYYLWIDVLNEYVKCNDAKLFGRKKYLSSHNVVFYPPALKIAVKFIKKYPMYHCKERSEYIYLHVDSLKRWLKFFLSRYTVLNLIELEERRLIKKRIPKPITEAGYVPLTDNLFIKHHINKDTLFIDELRHFEEFQDDVHHEIYGKDDLLDSMDPRFISANKKDAKFFFSQLQQEYERILDSRTAPFVRFDRKVYMTENDSS